MTGRSRKSGEDPMVDIETWAANQKAQSRKRRRRSEERKDITDSSRSDVSGREYRSQRKRYDDRNNKYRQMEANDYFGRERTKV